MKKVVFIVPIVGGGGAEKVLINIINTLGLDKIKVTLLSIKASEDFVKLLPANIDLIFLNKPNLRSAYKDIYRIIKKVDPDIVFTSLNHISLASIMIKMYSGLKYFPVVRLSHRPKTTRKLGLKGQIDNQLTKILFRKAHCIIAQTEEMRKEAISFYRMPPQKVLYIPNVINQQQISDEQTEAVNLNKNDYNIVTAGRLVHIKGYDILIEALAKVVRVHPNVRLHLLGQEGNEPGYKNKLVSLATTLGIADNIIFHGFKKTPYGFFKEADIFVLSSRDEGFPNVVLEALSLGTPVVVTNCANFEGIITHGDNGFIIPVEDADALAEAIINGKKLQRKKLVINNFDYTSFFESC